ncbi:unnamed protein product [Darwinula stevensoni]|uniref:Uncharacterized protein n=1 Tax=Darwinula stevensoni TaxID=69355 RepID=A0A7R9A9L1_9CRUS|nr:unnamed protein product [Darwinula stevensoni]CAG0897467.1 unnamed protein product [Darwinula stevensoni]
MKAPSIPKSTHHVVIISSVFGPRYRWIDNRQPSPSTRDAWSSWRACVPERCADGANGANGADGANELGLRSSAGGVSELHLVECRHCSASVPPDMVDSHEMFCPGLGGEDGIPVMSVSLPKVVSPVQAQKTGNLEDSEEDAWEEQLSDRFGQGASLGPGRIVSEPLRDTIDGARREPEVPGGTHRELAGAHAIPSSSAFELFHGFTYDDPALQPFVEQLEGVNADSSDEEIVERLRLVLSHVPRTENTDTVPCEYCHEQLPFDGLELLLHQTGCGREVFLGTEDGSLWIECRRCSFPHPLDEIQEHEESCRVDEATERQSSPNVTTKRDVWTEEAAWPVRSGKLALKGPEIMKSLLGWIRQHKWEILAVGLQVALLYLPWGNIFFALGIPVMLHGVALKIIKGLIVAICKLTESA